MSEPTDEERIRLIRQALRDCNQPETKEAILKQFRHETGRYPTISVRDMTRKEGDDA